MPIGAFLQIEHMAMEAKPSPMRFYARSMLPAGMGVSVRIQDALRAEPEEKGIFHDQIITKIRLSKGGAPMWVVAPTCGILNEWSWAEEHAQTCIRIGNVFPDYERVYGDGGKISKSQRLVTDAVATGRRV
eukprot:4225672-Pleurochrysis_carterae.AAC.1